MATYPTSRRSIRLPDQAYADGEPFLLTCCVAGRRPAFRDPLLAQAALKRLTTAAELTHSRLWVGVIMPDHVHMIVSADVGASPLDCAACFKRLTTVAAKELGWSGVLWQRRIHDRGIRTNFGGDLPKAMTYVLENPVRARLATSWNDWPYAWVAVDPPEEP